jgi:hypothetical protein
MMDEFLPVSPLARSIGFEPLMHSPVGTSLPAEFTERSGSYLSSIMNDELPPSMVHEDVSFVIRPQSRHKQSFVLTKNL